MKLLKKKKIHMRSQVKNQPSSHKFPKSIKMKSNHHALDDSSERKRERKRETCCRGGHRRRSERIDGRFAASQPQPIGDRPTTAPRSYVAGTTVSTSDATAEFREFQRSRSSPSIRLDRGRGRCTTHREVK